MLTNKILCIAIMLLLPCAAWSKITKTKQQKDRKIRVLIYPFEADLDRDYIMYFTMLVKKSLYKSKKYILVEKPEKELKDKIEYAKDKWKCKTRECTVSVLGDIYQFDVALLIEIKNNVASIKIVKSRNAELLLYYNEAYKTYKELKSFIAGSSEKLIQEIKNKYVKPDIFIEWELSASIAYAMNTGRLDFLNNGLGGLFELRAYAFYHNLFFKTQVGFFKFTGVNYATDTAYFMPYDLGVGHVVNVGETGFSVSPTIGLGCVFLYLQSGTYDDVNKTGILDTENSTKLVIEPYAALGLKVEYKWKSFRVFSGFNYNVFIEGANVNELFNQMTLTFGLLYMF